MQNNTPDYEKLTYNPSECDHDTMLKMSKSSFMLYNQCPRKYWWNYIALPDIRPPPTEAMVRGTQIHKTMETLIYDPTDEKTVSETVKIADEEGVKDDDGFNVMLELMVDLESQIGKYEVLSSEIKLTVYDETKDIWLVGAMDGLIQTEDGKVILVELKTGNFSDSKLSRTRLELCFYAYMIERTPLPRPTHFLYIAPDACNEKTLNKLMNQKRKLVGMGLTQGLWMLEKISLRSLNTFVKKYNNAVFCLKNADFPLKWNEFYCSQYCDYMIQCEPEMNGVIPDPTIEL